MLLESLTYLYSLIAAYFTLFNVLQTWMEEILYVYRGKAELCEEVDH